MYIIKKFEQSPFNQDDLGKNAIILCKKETGEPIASLSDKLPWYVKEGDEIGEGYFLLNDVSKSSKHLVVGDSVTFGYFLEGIIEKIESKEEGAWDWEDNFHLKDCKYIQIGDDTKLRKPIDELQVIKRKECESKEWSEFTIEFTEDKIWSIIEKEWSDIMCGHIPTTEQVINFFKERTTPKN